MHVVSKFQTLRTLAGGILDAQSFAAALGCFVLRGLLSAQGDVHGTEIGEHGSCRLVLRRAPAGRMQAVALHVSNECKEVVPWKRIPPLNMDASLTVMALWTAATKVWMIRLPAE